MATATHSTPAHETKQCFTCKQHKALDAFAPRKANRDGLNGMCRACDYERKKKYKTPERVQAWRARHAAKRGRTYRPTGKRGGDNGGPRRQPRPEARLENIRRAAKTAWLEWMDRAPDWWLDIYWRESPKPWNDPRLTVAEKYRMRYALDPEFVLRERMRRRVKKTAKRLGIATSITLALKRECATSPTVERQLGYSIADLRRHIERQFTKRMTWARFMAGDIHIDHIRPIASFDVSDDEEFRACWALSNLQPLWAKDNLAKGGRVVSLL
jgi:hypothetical protein